MDLPFLLLTFTYTKSTPQHSIEAVMGKTLDLSRRIEIHSMDKHCQDISIGLYREETSAGPRFLVHTYNKSEEAAERVAFIRQTLLTMLGLESAGADSDWLKFSCGADHLRALKRAFLDLCKLETGAPLEPKPLKAFDKKANCDLEAVSLGAGKYQMKSASGEEQATKRATALARGFAKLCEMHELDGERDGVQFPCSSDHQALIGMLMYRAQNVRASMKEEEQSAGRGVLAPPSQQ